MRLPAAPVLVLVLTACSSSPPTTASGPTAAPIVAEDPDAYYQGADGDTARRFASPTGNIRCDLDSVNDEDSVTCVIRERVWTSPRCRAGEVAGIGLGSVDASKPAVSCEQDDATMYRPLAYGHSITEIAITCTSKQDGMTCRVGDRGHGFVVSREKLETF